MKAQHLLVTLLAAGAALAARPDRAIAQDATSGAIQGVVTDAATGDPLAGVTIVVTGTDEARMAALRWAEVPMRQWLSTSAGWMRCVPKTWPAAERASAPS